MLCSKTRIIGIILLDFNEMREKSKKSGQNTVKNSSKIRMETGEFLCET